MSLDYLEYYAELPEPGYAVLIIGPWGVGKTFQVKQLLDARKPVYVSLYGEPDVASVHEAVLAASLPVTTTVRTLFDRIGSSIRNVGDSLGGVPGALIGTLGQAATSLVLRQLRQQIDKNRVIVFDDLERSLIETKELTGLINEYVEQHKCRVLVIANEEALPSDMSPIKEKLFGQTVTVEPQLDAALESFFRSSLNLDMWSDPIRRTVRDVFECSGVHSLRVARQLVHDVARLLVKMSDTQRADEEATKEAVGTFAAWAVEVRARRLERHHVNPASVAAVARALELVKQVSGDKQKDPEADDWETLGDAERRYLPLGIRLRSNPWPGDLLETLLFDGSFPTERIQTSLDLTPWFQTASALPAWRVLWSWHEYEDGELAEAAKRLLAQLRNRILPENPEDLVHLVTRMLHAATWGLVDMTVEQARQLCERYIDDVVGKLYPVETSGSGSSGLGFCDRKSPVWVDYQHVRRHLCAAVNTHIEQSLPGVANALLESLSTQGANAFVAGLENLPRSRQGKPLPCVHTLDADVFVARWLGRPAREQLPVAVALLDHCNQVARPEESENEEHRWISELCTALERAATEGTSMTQFRLHALARMLSEGN